MDDRDRIMIQNANNNRAVDGAKQLISLAVDALVLKGAGAAGKGINQAALKITSKSRALAPSGISQESQVIIKGKEATTAKFAGKTASGTVTVEKAKTATVKTVKEGAASKKTTKGPEKKSILWEAAKSFGKEEAVKMTVNKVAEEGGVEKEVGMLLKARKNIAAIKNGIISPLRADKRLDMDFLVNSASWLLLNKPNPTHGVFSASKWLTKSAPREFLIEKGKLAEKKLPKVKEDIQTCLDKNKEILEEKKIKVPENLEDKKACDAFMKGKSLPEETLKDKDWIKNKEEYFSLRKEEESLLRKIEIGERPSLDIAEETAKMGQKEIEQRALSEQMRTISIVNGNDDLLRGKSIPEIMNNDYVKSMGMADPSDAYKLVDEFNKLEEEKQLIAQNCDKQIEEGLNSITRVEIGATKSLLEDAKKILDSSEKNANADGDEEDIRRMRKA